MLFRQKCYNGTVPLLSAWHVFTIIQNLDVLPENRFNHDVEYGIGTGTVSVWSYVWPPSCCLCYHTQLNINVPYLCDENRDNIPLPTVPSLIWDWFCVLFIDLWIFLHFPFAGTVPFVWYHVPDTRYPVPYFKIPYVPYPWPLVVFRLRERWRPWTGASSCWRRTWRGARRGSPLPPRNRTP